MPFCFYKGHKTNKLKYNHILNPLKDNFPSKHSSKQLKAEVKCIQRYLISDMHSKVGTVKQTVIWEQMQELYSPSLLRGTIMLTDAMEAATENGTKL